MYKLIFFMLSMLLLLPACRKEDQIIATAVEKAGKLTVEFVDFEKSCDWNLRILDDVEVYNFQKTNKSEYLYGDMDRHNPKGKFKLGDILIVEFEVLEENPYIQRLIQCSVPHGIPVRLLSVEKI